MKTINKFALVLLVISVVSGLVGAIIIANTGIDIRELKTYEIDQTEDIELDGTNSININFVSTDVEIIQEERTDVEARFHGSLKTNYESRVSQLKTSKVGDRINIEVERPDEYFNIGFHFYDVNTKLDVRIPSDYANEIKINGVSGNVESSNLNLKALECGMISGDVKLSRSTIDRFNCASVSGDLDIGFSQQTPDIEVETISGDVEVEIPEETGFRLDWSTVSGDIQNDFPIIISSSSRNSLIGTFGDPMSEITVQTVSGDLKLEKLLET